MSIDYIQPPVKMNSELEGIINSRGGLYDFSKHLPLTSKSAPTSTIKQMIEDCEININFAEKSLYKQRPR